MLGLNTQDLDSSPWLCKDYLHGLAKLLIFSPSQIPTYKHRKVIMFPYPGNILR